MDGLLVGMELTVGGIGDSLLGLIEGGLLGVGSDLLLGLGAMWALQFSI